MKFISAQPDSMYFIWQLELQMYNFRNLGIEKDAIILFSFNEEEGINPNALKFSYETDAVVIFIPDKRDSSLKNYISTIRPHILKSFFELYASQISHGHDIFYHDSDILFRLLPDFKVLSNEGKIALSDTISYIGSAYIKSKGEGLLEEMCASINIDPILVEKNNDNSGGAQYFIPKNIPLTYSFWDKVEKDSQTLYTLMNDTSSKYNPSHPIQSWTADMWALLWSFWNLGYETAISKELSFSWPTYDIGEWEKHNIYHNAGVTPDRKDLFYKGAYTTTSPINLLHKNVNDKFCSFKYVEVMKNFSKEKFKTEKISCIMCTYGRFNMVERSLSFFMNQDFLNKELIIFNTAEKHLELDKSLMNENIIIVNNSISYITGLPYTNVGDVRRDALTHANGAIYSCWDDDDFFMPYHLSQSYANLIGSNKKAWKPKYSLWSQDGGRTFKRDRNNFEASILVYIDYLFFEEKTGDEHIGWLYKLQDEGQLDESVDVQPLESYCYVWGDILAPHKQSAQITDPNNFNNHKIHSIDFGERALTHIDVSNYYYNVWSFEKKDLVYEKLKIYISKYLSLN
jgi:hypothetical protein